MLGAQAIGEEGVDKRNGRAFDAVREKLTVSELGEYELCYAPPYGSAKDPVNMAGFAAENIVDGLVKVWHGADLEKLDRDKVTVLDVRMDAERKTASFPAACIFRWTSCAGRIGELDAKKRVRPLCKRPQELHRVQDTFGQRL